MPRGKGMTQMPLDPAEASPPGDPARTTVWTIGHSTRAFDAFVALLGEHGIRFLADVRHFPTSRRVPWTRKDVLPAALDAFDIGYAHLEDLGGYRMPRADSENLGWRTRGFRGYADHMDTPAFAKALGRLVDIASSRRTSVMCAEAVPWKCHRYLLSDALLARGVKVVHIMALGRAEAHRLTDFARLRDGRVTYPGAGAKVLKRRTP